MIARSGFVDAIGNTPLIKLRAASELTGCEVYGKAEFLNPVTCAVVSGGTLSGIARALKERNPDVKIALSDPMGASLYNWFTRGELIAEGESITEGIGQVRITKNFEGAPIDMAYRISDQEALPVLFDLIEQEGLVLGGSSAINIVGAIRLARDLGPGLITMPRGQKSSSAVGTRNCLPESNLIVSALASGTRRVLGKVGRRKSAQVIGAQAGQNGPGAEHVSFGALRVADFKRGTPPNVHGRSPVGAERARL